MRPKRRLLPTQVQSYQVEWDTNPGVAEVQTVTTSTYLGANELQTIRTFGKDLCGNQPVRRRRVDGVEDDATIQHERAVKF